MNKILTVVVPMYHVELYIGQCLSSFAIPEILDKIQILVIDDGGKDGSAQIARKFQENYPDTYQVIHKENGGHGSTINKGIELAEGKYFKVVDGDDWVDQPAFLNLVRHLEETDADMVLSNYYWVDYETGKKKTEVEEICPGIGYGVTVPISQVGDRIFMKMHAITYKTSVIRQQPERLDEHCFYVDTEYMLFPLPFVKTVSAVPDFVYQYRIGMSGQSMSPEKMQRQCAQHERVLKRLLQFYDQHKGEECTSILEKTLARIVTSQYKIYLMFSSSHKKQLLELERKIKQDYPAVYALVRNPAVQVLRKTGYVAYRPVSLVVRNSVKQ